MALRSGGRKLSFDILAVADYEDAMSTTRTASLSRSISDPPALGDRAASSPSRKKKKKKKNRKGKSLQDSFVISEDVITEVSGINGDVNYSCTVGTVTEAAVVPDVDNEGGSAVRTVTHLPQFGELRQRNVGNAMNGGSTEMVSEERGKDDEKVKEETGEDRSAATEISSDQRVELNGRKLEKEGTLDWKKLMAEDPNYTFPVEKSPMKYFMEEMYAGNALRSTTTIGNDKERERVYDTIFRLPWRCELLINFGFFVCFDSFLSLLTIMPTRIIMTFWRLLKTSSSRCLHQRSSLFSGRPGLENAPKNFPDMLMVHVVHCAKTDLAITLSTCIVAHNNALFAMLVSNNFAEIKSNVFKRYSKDNVHSLVYFDSVERFHISAFVIFVLAQNILEAEGPWFESFLCVIRVLRPVYAAHLPYHPLPWRIFWILVLLAMTFVMLASLKMMIGLGLRKHARWYVRRCERRKLHSD
ncbi:protein POLLEN DEFECTIVE IN GUIDANCE 1 [Sesamum angolense]|uniref:Protein POLLEN DEFECTIVE IN GUIDANCE 1 n=1 Tax=Sesamum angolense TaxID=2727404 RepID=A0AAE1WVS2_9LAMI|nr:protein POLLEN DEFECTIVE IN GUIDANCE 1 [Sesamum angolense]